VISDTWVTRALASNLAESVATPVADRDATALNVVDAAPAGTRTDAGTCRPALLLTSGMSALVVAAWSSVTVHDVEPPAMIVVELHATAERTDSGTTLIVALATEPFNEAEIFAEAAVETVPATALKLADFAPAATLTAVGAFSAALSEVRVTEVAAAAFPDSVTVQVVVAPALREPGAHVRLDTAKPGFTVIAEEVSVNPA
jgi:hypothetical protein